MNTKAIVIISILILVTLGSCVFAFVQQVKTQEAQKEAVEQKMSAEAARAEAERQRIEAEMQRVVGEDTMGKLQTALQELEQLKKRCK
jgi:uncharacterized protein HemX